MRARMAIKQSKDARAAHATLVPGKTKEASPRETYKARPDEKGSRQMAAPVRTEAQLPKQEPKPQAAPEKKPAIARKAKVEKAGRPPKAARKPLFARKPKAEKQPKASPKKMTPAMRIESGGEAARREPTPKVPTVSKVGPMDAAKPGAAEPKVARESKERAERFQGQPARSAGHLTPVTAAENKTEEELAQVKEILAEDFRRMGSTGASIPKDWLRALNSDEPKPRDLARIAISAYYMAFLRRYDISEESVKRITESIIRMMRKEDEFSSMSEKEAQAHLQKMLVDAGARFSSRGTNRGGGATARAEATSPSAVQEAKPEKDRKRKERRFLKHEAAPQKEEEVAETPINPQAVDTKLWQDKGGEEDWEWD